jgi:hypothetical protein
MFGIFEMLKTLVDDRCEKRHIFLRHCRLKMIILPRQAQLGTSIGEALKKREMQVGADWRCQGRCLRLMQHPRRGILLADRLPAGCREDEHCHGVGRDETLEHITHGAEALGGWGSAGSV